jgi:hypothetical protein
MPYTVGGKGDPGFDGADPLKIAAHSAHIGEWFRANYRKAEQLAKQRTP